jgi:hypothetical protein
MTVHWQAIGKYKWSCLTNHTTPHKGSHLHLYPDSECCTGWGRPVLLHRSSSGCSSVSLGSPPGQAHYSLILD